MQSLTAEQQEIITKVQKLLSLSKSLNEHEAALALAKAEALLEKYRLDMTQIEMMGQGKEAIVQEHIPGQSNHELFRVIHDWDWNDAETLLTEGREDLVTR